MLGPLPRVVRQRNSRIEELGKKVAKILESQCSQLLESRLLPFRQRADIPLN